MSIFGRLRLDMRKEHNEITDEESIFAGDGADSACKSVPPTANHSAVDGHHVDRAYRRGPRQCHL